MANVDAAFGMRPVRHLTGGQIRANEYKIESGTSSNILIVVSISYISNFILLLLQCTIILFVVIFVYFDTKKSSLYFFVAWGLSYHFLYKKNHPCL